MSSLARSRLLRPVRDRMGRWLHSRIDLVAQERIRRALAAESEAYLLTPRRWGPTERLHVAPTAVLNDALLNTVSGSITLGDHVFLGHGVALLTGTHDTLATGLDRQRAVPESGRDIVIGSGVWVASRATVIGPCEIGADAVVAAGAVVTADVPPAAIVAGNPARLVGRVGERAALPPCARVMTEVGTLSVHPHDEVITPHLRAHGSWDPADCELMRRELSPGGAAIDVGANIGYMTLVAAQAVGPTGSVIAVEPHPDNLALLRDNLVRNGVTDRVRVVGAAAWDSRGSVELAECVENTGDHRVDTLQTERRVLSVEAVRLDDIVSDGPRVDVIKLDTQATEHRALKGAVTLLARDRPVVLCEYWPHGLRDRGEDPLAVLATFRGLGYDIEVPDEPHMARCDDITLTESIHARNPGPNGGFATLRLTPRG